MTFGDTERRRAPRAERPRVTKKFNKNFWKWFGNSKIVNPEDGSPRIVYHGTGADEEFTVFYVPSFELGVHVGTKEQAAKFVADDDDFYSYGDMPPEVSAGRVYPLYASIQNPLRLNDSGSWEAHVIYSASSGNRKTLIEAGVFPDVKHMNQYLVEYRKAERKKRKAIESYHKLREDQGYAAGSDWEARDAENALYNLQHKEIIFFRDLLESKGYDGIVYLNMYEGQADDREVTKQTVTADDSLTWLNKVKTTPSKESTKGKKSKRPKIISEDSYIVWNPAQLKAAIGNRGTWDMSDPDVLHGLSVFGGLRMR